MKNKKLSTQLFLGIALISFNCSASNPKGSNDMPFPDGSLVDIFLSQSRENVISNHDPVASTSTSTSTTGAEQHSPNYNSIVFGGVRGYGTRWKQTDGKDSLVVNIGDSADIKANAFKVSDLEQIQKKLDGVVDMLHFEKMGLGLPIAWGDILKDIDAGKTKEQIDWKFVEVPGYLKDFPAENAKTHLKSADYTLGNAYKDAKDIAKIYASMLKSDGKLKYESYVLSAGTDRNVSPSSWSLSHAFALVPDIKEGAKTYNSLLSLRKVFGDPFVSIKEGFRINKVYNATFYFAQGNNADLVADNGDSLDSYYDEDNNTFQPAVDKKFLQKGKGRGVFAYKYNVLLQSHYYLTQIYKIVLGKAGFENIKVFLKNPEGDKAQIVVEATKK